MGVKIFALALVALFAVARAADYPPVKVALYYETLCPYCREYFTGQLYPTYQELKDIMDVHLYPFGNAKYYPKQGGGYTFVCQHGADECTGNMIHACAQHYITDFDVEMDFVNCLLSEPNPANAGAPCAKKVGVDYTPIDNCVNSQEGEEDLHDVALEQEKLDPALYFTPWILVDDQFSQLIVDECERNMMKVVCTHYTGPSPPECDGVLNAFESYVSAHATRPQVCYKQ